MSFKLVNVFGLDINPSIIFSSGILIILYYFINRYDIKEYKKLIMLISATSIICGIYLLSNSFMVPSIYDKGSLLYKNIILDNLVILIVFPISLLITFILNNIKKIRNNSYLIFIYRIHHLNKAQKPLAGQILDILFL